MRSNDTIAAIATPHGVGGIAVVRLSGPKALEIAQTFISQRLTEPRKACFATFCAGESVIDEVVVTYFKAPASYTGDDTIEISCHGSLYVQQTILQRLIDNGARLAEPGEFTLRAFLNGKFNLSQAEAVADLIDSTTPAQHKLAISQLRGGYAQELKRLRQQLIELTSLLELELDFSQEDVEFADRSQLRQLLSDLTSSITQLTSSFTLGNALKHGIPVAIVGAPNVGKSTLLNAILHDDRAMVSNVPGTTRDTVEESFTVDGITFRFIDTAGIRSTDDPLESMGIERSYRAIQRADIILLLHEASVPMSEFSELSKLNNLCDIKEKTVLLVHTKCDLCQPDTEDGIRVIAREGVGIDQLEQCLVNQVRKKMLSDWCAVGSADNDILIANERHRDALQQVLQALNHVDGGLKAGLSADLVAIDLRDALHHLGTITGEVSTDEVLGTIFSRFCIGK